jgi:hypothetical protein
VKSGGDKDLLEATKSVDPWGLLARGAIAVLYGLR